MRLLGDRRDWARDLAVATAAGMFLGLVGPFGSYLNGPPMVRLGYWLAALWAGTCLFGVILRPAVRGARRFRLPLPAALAVATLLAAVPIALLCQAVAMALWPGPIGRIGVPAFYAQTLVISAPIALGYGLLDARRPRPRLPHEEVRQRPRLRHEEVRQPPPPAPTDFLSRLPGRLGRELVALQMEDHYVRAHTSRGSALVLIPLHQAIRELDGIPGLRVHRFMVDGARCRHRLPPRRPQRPASPAERHGGAGRPCERRRGPRRRPAEASGQGRAGSDHHLTSYLTRHLSRHLTAILTEPWLTAHIAIWSAISGGGFEVMRVCMRVFQLGKTR